MRLAYVLNEALCAGRRDRSYRIRASHRSKLRWPMRSEAPQNESGLMGRFARRAEEWRLTMSQMRIAVVAILGAWAVFFSVGTINGLFWLGAGEIPLGTDSRLAVNDVDSAGPAGRAGIRLGDRVEEPVSLADRLYLEGLQNVAPGHSFAFLIRGKNGLHLVNFRVGAMLTGEPDAATTVYYSAGVIIDLIFIVVGSILVLSRPSRMTWAFFLYCVAMAPGLYFRYWWLPAWTDYGARVVGDILRSASCGAFLIFCVRVPNDRVFGNWRYLESVAAPTVFVTLLICNAVFELSLAGVLHAELIANNVQNGILNATYIAGLLALIATFWRERDVDRSRVGWMVAGFATAFAARAGQNFSDPYGPLYVPAVSSWPQLIPEVLQLAIPLTIVYAVVRHSALNAGFVANRTLVYGLFLCVGLAVFGSLDVLATKRFASNQLQVGLDVAIALAIGLSFHFVHPRAIRLVQPHLFARALSRRRCAGQASSHLWFSSLR